MATRVVFITGWGVRIEGGFEMWGEVLFLLFWGVRGGSFFSFFGGEGG